MTNEELIKAIEKYQKIHPLHFGTLIDLTTISSKDGVDILGQTIDTISKKINEDTDLWCICEMAKLYLQGVTPVYVEPKRHNQCVYCIHSDKKVNDCENNHDNYFKLREDNNNE